MNMQFQEPSPSNNRDESAELSPFIEITCPADFSAVFSALLSGKDMDCNATQFMTNVLSEEIQETAGVIMRAYHDYLFEGKPTLNSCTAYFKVANSILGRLYKESTDIDDVPQLLKLSEFLWELGGTLEDKCNKLMHNHNDFYLDRLNFITCILKDAPHDLPRIDKLESCIAILQKTPEYLQCETLNAVTRCVNSYAASKMWQEALLCAEWLGAAINDLRFGNARFYRGKTPILKRVPPYDGERDKLIWDGTRASLLACGALYEKTFQPLNSVKCYTVLAEMIKRQYFKSDESHQLCLADILCKRAYARSEAKDFEGSNHDAERALKLVNKFGDSAKQTRSDVTELLERNPIIPREPDYGKWGFNTTWTPDQEDDSGGLLD